ncbi:hypothetical protein H072_2231 [Dactylellina haptotyla CBS 200.50]|uniref:Dimethylallyltranstransferase n=1 Tax=Dactylellina haptotyla (strain CBS 200.50) TaxID=1284197 RepID=S8AS28_DACHA|nr:hypothetical protein H072_2231 [Dactylellina haptotyla CBS 200.50]
MDKFYHNLSTFPTMDSAAKKLLRVGIDPDETSMVVDIRGRDTQGISEGFPVRVHKDAWKADKGGADLERDWVTYIGPVTSRGGQSPNFGTFPSLGLVFNKAERLRLFGFLYDDQLETSENASFDMGLGAEETAEQRVETNQSASNAQQLQSKIALQILKMDRECGEVLINIWKEMVAHSTNMLTLEDNFFHDFEAYIDSRIIDTGCLGGVMLFGLGATLTDEEYRVAAEVLRPCWASLALVNDYFSFEKEYREYLEKGTRITNSIWFYKQARNIDISEAKGIVREQINGFEQGFLRKRAAFYEDSTGKSEALLKYIETWYYVIGANTHWSSDCYRYNSVPKVTRDEAPLKAEQMQSVLEELTISGSSTPNSQNSESPEIWAGESKATTPTVSETPEETTNGEGLDTELLLAPYEYLRSMPSKGVRETFVNALNLWFAVPDKSLQQIKNIGQILHTASLMLDDMQDNSTLRRGQDAAHIRYGQPQTINSANYLIMWAAEQVSKLESPACSTIFFDEIRNSLIGQSYEIDWKDKMVCPTEDQYIDMVEKKTGGLFRFLTRLITTLSRKNKTFNLDKLASNIGQYFQIRDDFMNLTYTKYTDQKGFCEDLDEGKFSYLIVHAWNREPTEDSSRVRALFQERAKNRGLNREAKEEILAILQRTGSFQYTETKMQQLQREIDEEVTRFEKEAGIENWSLQLLLYKLYTN